MKSPVRKRIRKMINQVITESQKTHLPSSKGDQSLTADDFYWAGSDEAAQEAFEQESEGSRDLKKAFHAASGDLGQTWFRDNVLMVHGSSSPDLSWFESKIESGRNPNRREISVNAFLKENLGTTPISGWSSNPAMLIIEGHVSYAGVEDLRSSYYSKNYSKRPHTEFGSSFMTGDDSSKKHFRSHSMGQKWDGFEEVEFIVANWTVSGVIVDTENRDNDTAQQAVKIAQENGYPVYNTLLQRIA